MFERLVRISIKLGTDPKLGGGGESQDDEISEVDTATHSMTGEHAEGRDIHRHHANDENWNCESQSPIKTGFPFLYFLGPSEGIYLSGVGLVREHGVKA